MAVPNIEMDTWQAIRSGEDHIQTMFKSEVSFETAYSGFETRKIIMEERNVYCGAYNVMVLLDLYVKFVMPPPPPPMLVN